ncbi:MAG: hypothetical protein KDK66_04510 [Deltaproteobacteria bacterium]|nr:hypothetical protein [Deltaproteobacteria bacterium]
MMKKKLKKFYVLFMLLFLGFVLNACHSESGLVLESHEGDSLPNSESPETSGGVSLPDEPPQVYLITSISSPTNVSVIQILIDFGEEVSGFEASDIMINRGEVFSFADLGRGRFQVGIAPVSEGEVTISVPEGVAFDAIGQANQASAELVMVYDFSPPDLVLSSAETSPSASSSIVVELSASEAIQGLSLSDVVLENALATQLEALDSQHYQLTLSPLSDGEVEVTLPPLVLQDLAGNDNRVSQHFSIVYDGTAPTVLLSSLEANPSSNNPFVVYLNFSEAITGLSLDSLSANNASLGNLVTIDSFNYSLEVSPLEEGSVEVSLPSGQVSDSAGNLNTASNIFSITFVAVPVYLDQDFEDLADGSPWPSPWMEETESPVLEASIQNGQACLSAPVYVAGPLSTALARMRLDDTVQAQDFEASFEMTYEDFHHQGFGFLSRLNEGYLNLTTPPQESYSIFIEGGYQDCAGLWYNTGGSNTRYECGNLGTILGVPVTPASFTPTPSFAVRYQVEQVSVTETIQRLKVWQVGELEPNDWQVVTSPLNDTLPASLQNTTGGFALDVYNYSGGGDYSVCIDNILITGIPPI